MARIRTIKPEFFLHEGLAELPPLHRLLFVGLWTLADKYGYLEDRPRRIKAALFPWDDCDVDDMLGELDSAGLIQRYEVDGDYFIAIPSFLRHQRPHPKETGFGIPDPPSREKVRPCREISRQAKPNPHPIPSSPAGKEVLDNGKEVLEASNQNAEPPEKTNPTSPRGSALQQIWNTHKAPEMPEWRTVSSDREKHVRARLKENSDPGFWVEVVQRLAQSALARGLIPGYNGRYWVADPDFLLRPGSAAKVLEGKYDDRGKQKPKPSLAEQLKLAEQQQAVAG